jgi:DNA-binding NarL/FixJ family response regulator
MTLSKPTVLLVDDDVGILKAISRILAAEFQVVAALTNGHEAVEHVCRRDPDVVVLDIGIPGLDGFETAVQLKRNGSLAKLLFLTSHSGDDYVIEAIKSGASGYVLKHSAWANLMPALRHVLAGREFLPALAPLAKRMTGAHALHGHPTTTGWLEGVADLLNEALYRGDVIAVVLTPSHRDDFALRLAKRQWNLDRLKRLGRYLAFDVDDVSRRIVRNARLNPDSVVEMVDSLERARVASAGGPARCLTIVGEIAARLCQSGNLDAAIELERLWDELTRPLPILTVCAYPTEWLDQRAPPDLVSGICAQHAVITSESDA